MGHRVAVLALPNVVTFDLGCVLAIFAPAPGPQPVPRPYDLVVCGSRRGRLATADGFAMIVEHDLAAVAAADTVLVVGYTTAADAPPPPNVVTALREAAARGARMGSVCVGAFALGHAGLLDGRRCTTHWAAVDLLVAQFPSAQVSPNELYVEDGPVVTSAGSAAGLDLGLHLVRRDHGAEVAADLARWAVVAPHRAGGQAQFIRRPASSEPDNGTGALREWAMERLDRPLSLAELAARACCSERTLTRRFLADTGLTPKQWLITARLQRARELLEGTDLPIERVAAQSGFPSGGALRACFAGALSTTPTAYRQTFASASRSALAAPAPRTEPSSSPPSAAAS